jgi:beta-galactosidase/beta-glucuronidase
MIAKICEKKHWKIGSFQKMPSEWQEWEIAWYLQRKEEKLKYLDQLLESLKTTNKKGETVIKDFGAYVTILLERFES